MTRPRLDTDGLERYESLFIAPHGDDVALGCPARVLGEVERGRRVLVLALFEPVGSDSTAARAVRELGADYVAAGLPAAGERRAGAGRSSLVAGRRAQRGGRRSRGRAAPDGNRAAHAGRARLRAARAGGLDRPPPDLRGRRAGLRHRGGPQPLPVRGAARGVRAGSGADPAGAARGASPSGRREGGRARRAAAAPLAHERAGSAARAVGRGRGAAVGARRGAGALPRWRGPGTRRGPTARGSSRSCTWPTPTRRRGPRRSWTCCCPGTARGGRGPRSGSTRVPPPRRRSWAGVYHAERFWLFLPSGDGLPEVQHPLERAEV